jgi:hypothetical protein
MNSTTEAAIPIALARGHHPECAVERRKTLYWAIPAAAPNNPDPAMNGRIAHCDSSPRIPTPALATPANIRNPIP